MTRNEATRPRGSRAVLLLLIGTTVLFAGLLAWTVHLRASLPPAFHGTVYEDAPPAPDFALTDHTGQPVRLSELRGDPVLLFFGYTRCPDACPLTLNKLHRLLERMEVQPGQAHLLLVTVDPEHDTPAMLAEYAERYDGYVRALTGAPEALAAIREEYGVYAVPAQPAPAGAHHGAHAPPAEAQLAHNTQVFGIDRAGRLRVLISADQPEEVVMDDLQTLLEL